MIMVFSDVNGRNQARARTLTETSREEMSRDTSLASDGNIVLRSRPIGLVTKRMNIFLGNGEDDVTFLRGTERGERRWRMLSGSGVWSKMNPLRTHAL
jgi:hypothetical protein